MESTLSTTDRSRPRATTTSVVAALLPIMAVVVVAILVHVRSVSKPLACNPVNLPIGGWGSAAERRS